MVLKLCIQHFHVWHTQCTWQFTSSCCVVTHPRATYCKIPQLLMFSNLSFAPAGTGNSPAQSSTRSISPKSTSPGQFIHQQLHNSSGTALNLVAAGITSAQQPVRICLSPHYRIWIRAMEKYQNFQHKSRSNAMKKKNKWNHEQVGKCCAKMHLSRSHIGYGLIRSVRVYLHFIRNGRPTLFSHETADDGIVNASGPMIGARAKRATRMAMPHTSNIDIVADEANYQINMGIFCCRSLALWLVRCRDFDAYHRIFA